MGSTSKLFPVFHTKQVAFLRLFDRFFYPKTRKNKKKKNILKNDPTAACMPVFPQHPLKIYIFQAERNERDAYTRFVGNIRWSFNRMVDPLYIVSNGMC